MKWEAKIKKVASPESVPIHHNVYSNLYYRLAYNLYITACCTPMTKNTDSIWVTNIEDMIKVIQ